MVTRESHPSGAAKVEAAGSTLTVRLRHDFMSNRRQEKTTVQQVQTATCGEAIVGNLREYEYLGLGGVFGVVVLLHTRRRSSGGGFSSQAKENKLACCTILTCMLSV